MGPSPFPPPKCVELSDHAIALAQLGAGQNIKRVREAQRLSFSELARMMRQTGRRIPVLGLRKIETMERRVDFDELLALAYVLQVCPVDLMISKEATDEPYPVIPTREFDSESVREWIRGETVHLSWHMPDEAIFAEPGKLMPEALEWMPRDRARRVGSQFYGAGDEDLDQ
jgi:transcriptional regulator with XRE-family HTH domain